MSRRAYYLVLIGLLLGAIIGACSVFVYLSKTGDRVYTREDGVFIDSPSRASSVCIVSGKTLAKIFGDDLDYSKLYSTINNVMVPGSSAGLFIDGDFWPNSNALLEYSYDTQGPFAEGSFTLLYLSKDGPKFCTVTFSRTGAKFAISPFEMKNWKPEYRRHGTLKNAI